MFYSQSFLSRKGPLGVIWVAAYCFKRLKKAQVTQTDISSSVDKILQDEFDVVTYRVLAYLLLGIVRIFSKKVEYLFDDCNKVLLRIKDFVVRNKERSLVQTLHAPYLSITLPERFELDAFDLGILEDTSEGNVMPYEAITLKDGMLKTGAIVPYSINQELAIEPGFCTQNYITNDSSEVSIEKFRESGPDQCKSMEFVIFPTVEKDHVQPFGESDHDKAAMHTMAIQVVDSDEMCAELRMHTRAIPVVDSYEMHAEPSMQELWDNSIFHEAGLNIQIFDEVEEESEKTAKSFGNHRKTDEEHMNVPDTTQLEHENQEVIREVGNICNLEPSMEKLRDNVIAQEEQMDVEIVCLTEQLVGQNRPIEEKIVSNSDRIEVDEPPKIIRPFSDEDQSSTEHKSLLEMTSQGNSIYRAFTEDHPLSLTLNTIPQYKFPDDSGVAIPEISLIPTPAAKERARVRRKRKCVFDDIIVFPNKVIKQFIEDPTDLVSKRRKAPCTALDAWRACRISCLSRCLLESLVPCISLELESLLSGKRLKILESLDATNVAQVFASGCLTVSESPEKSDKSKLCNDGQFVETVDPLRRLNASVPPTISRQGEAVELAETFDMTGSPSSSRPLEQVPIAPETPVLHAQSLRSVESPDRPEVPNLDGRSLELERVEKELPHSKECDFLLDMMNEELTSCEGDNENQYGWSARTRVVLKCLQRSFQNKKKRRHEEVVNILQLVKGRTKKESANFFYEILMLKSKGYVNVKQENAFGDIFIRKASQWGQAFGEDNVEAIPEN